MLSQEGCWGGGGDTTAYCYVFCQQLCFNPWCQWHPLIKSCSNLSWICASSTHTHAFTSADHDSSWVFLLFPLVTVKFQGALLFDIFSQYPGNCSAPKCPWFSTPLDLGFFTLDQVDISGTGIESFLQAFSPLLVCNTLLLVEWQPLILLAFIF